MLEVATWLHEVGRRYPQDLTFSLTTHTAVNAWSPFGGSHFRVWRTSDKTSHYPKTITVIITDGGEKCLFFPCNASWTLQTFKTVALQIIATVKVKLFELNKTLSGSDSVPHKFCYCSNTSKSRNNEEGKRKSIVTDTGPPQRLLKSECSDLVFKRDCLLSGNECKSKDTKSPHCWVRVRQCSNIWRSSVRRDKTSGLLK